MSRKDSSPDRPLVSRRENSESKPTWVDAAIILGNDPEGSVLCPECGQANLEVRDVRVGDILDRYMACPICKKYNVLTSNLTLQRKLSSEKPKA